MNYPELADLMIKVRRKHRFFAQPDREHMECQCGAIIDVRQADPWDDFEAHRVDMIIAQMIAHGTDLR